MAEAIFDIFGSEGLALTNKPGMCKALQVQGLSDLQCYWVDTQLRGRGSGAQGIEWLHQRQPGLLAAALGRQRASPLGKHALPALLPQSLCKEKHLLQSASVAFPFDLPILLDNDLAFTARALATLGPFARTWRRKQSRGVQILAARLAPWETQARAFMHQDVA